MPTSSKFPLLLLPLLVLNQVLKLMTPFELIAVSLCSKRSKHCCKSIRTKAQCEKPGYLTEFRLAYTVIQEIRLSFYGTTGWVVFLTEMPQITRKPKGLWSRVKSVFRKQKATRELEQIMPGVHYSGIIIKQNPEKNEHFLILRHTGDHVSATKRLVLYFEDLFQINLKEFYLHINPFSHEENLKIMDTFGSKPLSDFQLSCRSIVGESNQALVCKLLDRQTANKSLHLNFDTTAEFRYNFKNLTTNLDRLTLSDARWMNLEDLFDVDVQFLFLRKTNFQAADLKKLVQKWINGWRSKWIAVMICFCEDVELDDLIVEILEEVAVLEAENDQETPKSRFLRREQILETQEGNKHRIEHGIYRPKFVSGIISMTNRRGGVIQFYTQPEKSIFSETFDGTSYNLY